MFLIIGLVFLAVIFITYHKTRDYNIAVINCALWFIFTMLVCILDLPKNENAFIFVLMASIAFAFSYVIMQAKPASIMKNNDNWEIKGFLSDDSKFKRIHKYVFVLNIFNVIYLFNFLGFNIFTFANISVLMTHMQHIAYLRYVESVETLPLLSRLINVLVYATCGYDGFFFAKTREKYWLMNLVGLLMQMVMLNAKSVLVFGLAFFVGGVLTGLKYFHIRVKIVDLCKGFLAILLFIIFFVLINYFRHAAKYDIYTELQKIMFSYVVGPLSAFSIWYEYADESTMELGANTFTCVFRILGLIEQHTHGEFLYVGDLTTNVYTLFKHLVNDFSKVGTILIFSLLGFFSSIVDSKVARRDDFYVGISIVLFSLISVAFFSSLFRYTVNFLACLIILFASLPVRFVLK